MSTAAQILANQENAKSSTGPKTPEGKAAASQNNLHHGLRGKFTILATEDPQEFASLFEALRLEHQPTTTTEQLLVDRMAEHEWLSRRAQYFMDQTLTEQGTDNEKALALWLRYQTTHDRGFHRCLAHLLKLRNEKRKEQIGFERQKHEEAENTRRQDIAEAKTRAVNAQANLKELDFELKATIDAPLRAMGAWAPKNPSPALQQAFEKCLNNKTPGLL